MNKLKLIGIASLLATGIAHATTPCDTFKIKIMNTINEDLFVTSIQLHGAKIQPNGLQKIDKNSEEVFTVNGSKEEIDMQGKLVFHTISIPSKKVHVTFDLKNEGLFCAHKNTSPKGDFEVTDARRPGQVNYSISNK